MARPPVHRPVLQGQRPALRMLAICALYVTAAAAQACEGLQVEAPWVREPPPGAGAVAAFMTLRNTGEHPLVVDGISADGYGMSMLHETVRDGDRVRMQHRHTVSIPPGSSVELAPGGLHVMLMHPATAPRAGDSVSLTFRCGERSYQVAVPIRRAPP